MNVKLAIDITNLVSWKGNFSGIQRVIYQLSKSIADISENVRFFYVVDDGKKVLEVERIDRLNLNLTPEKEFRFTSQENVLLLSPLHIYHKFFEFLEGERCLLDLNIYAVVYDMTPTLFSDFHPEGVSGSFSWALHRSSEVVDKYLCISKSTEHDLLSYFSSVGKSVKSEVFRLGDEILDVVPTPVEGIKSPFVIYVSTLEPRKNHQFLVESWIRLGKEMLAKGVVLPKLFLIGKKGWHQPEFMKKFESKYLENDLVFLRDDVSDGQLAWMYMNCEFTIYASMYEGWGLPIAESMYYRKACISSNTSSMPEIFPEGCLFFSPTSYNELKEAVETLVCNKQEINLLESLIKSKFKGMSWNESASEVYRKLLSAKDRKQKNISFVIDGEWRHTVENDLCSFIVVRNDSDLDQLIVFDVYRHAEDLKGEDQICMSSFIVPSRTVLKAPILGNIVKRKSFKIVSDLVKAHSNEWLNDPVIGSEQLRITALMIEYGKNEASVKKTFLVNIKG